MIQIERSNIRKVSDRGRKPRESIISQRELCQRLHQPELVWKGRQQIVLEVQLINTSETSDSVGQKAQLVVLRIQERESNQRRNSWGERTNGVVADVKARDDADISARDLAAKRDYAATLSSAAKLLLKMQPPRQAVQNAVDTRQFGGLAEADPVLRALSPPLAAPRLRLQDLDGTSFALDAHRDQVVLVNFWASWCRPCVTEIPSLHRLEAMLEDTDFRIVTVNVGEDRERVRLFLQQVPVELPLLMDYDAAISKDWMIYVYPSSYLVDRQGKIRYAYLGALEWDSTENLRIIRNLLSER